MALSISDQTVKWLSKACRSLIRNQLWSFWVLWKQSSFTFAHSWCHVLSPSVLIQLIHVTAYASYHY